MALVRDCVGCGKENGIIPTMGGWMCPDCAEMWPDADEETADKGGAVIESACATCGHYFRGDELTVVAGKSYCLSHGRTVARTWWLAS